MSLIDGFDLIVESLRAHGKYKKYCLEIGIADIMDNNLTTDLCKISDKSKVKVDPDDMLNARQKKK